MAGHTIVLEHDAQTGRRLKYYSRRADVGYWTELWAQRADQPYARERRGHLPHQLRGTFGRWVRRGARVLEAGCGLGHFTVAAHALGYGAEGLDWSTDAVARLRNKFPEIPWHVGDVRSLAFDDGSFDAVYSPGVCEHFEEGPVRILTETRRVLRTGGFAVVSTPCFNRWLQARSARFEAEQPTGDFYQYAFTPDGMARLLETLGFDLLQVRPYGALDTMMTFAGWKPPEPLVKPLAFAMDYAPVLRERGSSCVWVARRRG